jgi:hypothetical protein
MMQTPSVIPYQGLEQFLAVPAYIIPRALWPDKPVLAKGIWYSITYLNLPTQTTTSAAITIFGEGYVFAGWIGMVLVALSTGLLLAFLYRWTVSTGLIVIFIALIPKVLDIESQFTGMFVSIIQSLILYLVVYWLICRYFPAQQPLYQVKSTFP